MTETLGGGYIYIYIYMSLFDPTKGRGTYLSHPMNTRDQKRRFQNEVSVKAKVKNNCSLHKVLNFKEFGFQGQSLSILGINVHS